MEFKLQKSNQLLLWHKIPGNDKPTFVVNHFHVHTIIHICIGQQKLVSQDLDQPAYCWLKGNSIR